MKTVDNTNSIHNHKSNKQITNDWCVSFKKWNDSSARTYRNTANTIESIKILHENIRSDWTTCILLNCDLVFVLLLFINMNDKADVWLGVCVFVSVWDRERKKEHKEKAKWIEIENNLVCWTTKNERKLSHEKGLTESGK